MNNIISKVKDTIKNHKLFFRENYLMLMVSGGSDSVALCYIVDQLIKDNKKFAIMHLNHKIRKEAEDDACFVKNLAKYFNVDFYLYEKNLKNLSSKYGENLEALGHKYRYSHANDAIDKWSKKHNINKSKILLCSAHTADDRIENFYMRSIVGTGPGGLKSIDYKNNNCIRPLLDIEKKDLQKFLNTLDGTYRDNNDLLWHEDRTNNDTDRFRAYVRHKIIPSAKKQNPGLSKNLINTMNLIADENKFLENLANKIQDKHIQFKKDSFKILPGFYKEDVVLKRRVLYNALHRIFDENIRVESKSIYSILKACSMSNYTDNIQCNYAIHSNKTGVLVEPMHSYRKRRNRI